jgi:hypothetical protein
MKLKPGLKLRSAASAAQVIVIRAPEGEVDLTCAGAPMSTDEPANADQAATSPDLLVGKRYGDPEGTIELLCTAPGAGPLALGGTTLGEQAAKSLPSSD